MEDEQLPTVPITSPLQIPLLPLTLLELMQAIAAMGVVRAMGGTTEEGSEEEATEVRTIETGPGIKAVEPDRILRRNNITINKSEKIIDEEVPGHVDEVMIKSTSNFSIELSIDDTPLLHESMTDLLAMSGDLSCIVAMHSDGTYRFSITDLTYNKLFLRVFLEGSGTFGIFSKLRRDPHAN